MRFFFLNKKFKFYSQLSSIMESEYGLEKILKKELSSLDNIELAFIFGSFASRKHNELSDVDLMIIGNPNQDKLIDIVEKIENKFGREVNYHVISFKEVRDRMKKRDKFLRRVFSGPIIKIIGDLGLVN